METVKRIVADDPVRQLWKMLRLYLDAGWAAAEIRRLHGVPEGEHDDNLRKQAEQIGYCIRQAEEYFQASAQVGLATRPLLLYYGAVALGTALYLLKLDGKHSFDALRAADKHQHHGLDLDRARAGAIRPGWSLEQFFGALQSDVFVKPTGDGKGHPWGHFALFYRALGEGDHYAMPARYGGRGVPGTLATAAPVLGASKRPLEGLVGAGLTGLSLLTHLPDMYPFLEEMGLPRGVCQGTCSAEREQVRPAPEGLLAVTLSFAIFAENIEQRDRLVAYYRKQNPALRCEGTHGTGALIRGTWSVTEGVKMDPGYLPDVINDVHGRAYYVIDPASYVVEPAAQLALLFALGMLARYYPDVWMRVIDSNARVAEVTDAFLNVAYRKFPNLILDQMRGAMHLVQQGAWSS